MTSNALIGIAGVHSVAAELSRRGMIALPTVRNTAAYDIVALNVEGTRHANIQVKASSKKVSFFPMPHASKVRDGRHDYYVQVRWLKHEKCYDCFLLKGKEARIAVRSGSAHQAGSIRKGTAKKVFPAIYVSRRNEREMVRWRRAWEKWAL
jgi:hypothetical protein